MLSSLPASGRRRWSTSAAARPVASASILSRTTGWALICSTLANSSGCSSAYIAPTSTTGRASAWRLCSGSSTATVGGCGPRRPSTKARHFPLRLAETALMTENVVEILLAEDNPNDVELTLHALKRHNLANRIHVVGDGAEALEFIFCTGAYAHRDIANG